MNKTLCKLLGHGDLTLIDAYHKFCRLGQTLAHPPVRSAFGKFKCHRCQTVIVTHATASHPLGTNATLDLKI